MLRKLISRIKYKLGICLGKRCLKKGIWDMEIKVVNYKGCLCERHKQILEEAADSSKVIYKEIL